ncbi:hypothetical protein B0A48_17875 [Cryoendolithus antarcticus]|uniref:Tetratricopeptide SHNi-TPR domain-containing protein n=1 Tax=Cryoendolithus antarcticus TaxID=1507870 RepID=A0A1V8SA92_9PEZI|nr:hypothetical protein B0A48_17875 [Cryoendolithus antarcticus]
MASTEPTPNDAPINTPTDASSSLPQLLAQAQKLYALKRYLEAADLYSEAAALQDEVHGEMAPENAEVLFQYGRCLYYVGVGKSDVLGGKVAATSGEAEGKSKKRKRGKDEGGEGEGVIGKAMAEGSGVGEMKGEVKSEDAGAKPFFQITGDENWTDSEGEEDDGEDAQEGEGEEEEEEQDDFSLSYEILDLARVLFRRKLDTLLPPPTEPPASLTGEARHLTDRLAEIHDLQAEVKLENEQFHDAVADCRAALTLKLQLYPPESGMLAEAHYKLAIALDFASLPVSAPEGEDDARKEGGKEAKKEEGKVDEELKAEAVSEMEAAISSCQLRITKEETALSSLRAAKQAAAKAGIADVKSMVSEMRNRLVDLKTPTHGPAISALALQGEGEACEELKGVMGKAMVAGSKAESERVVQEAVSGARDLGGLVRKGKRKAENIGNGEGGEGKKAKVEDA